MTFRLDARVEGPRPEPERAARSGLDGTWRARFDWRLAPVEGVASRSGIALATFANPAVGEACVRFEEATKTSKRGAERHAVTNGAFTFLGGTGKRGPAAREDASDRHERRALYCSAAVLRPATLLGRARYAITTFRVAAAATTVPHGAAGAPPLPPDCLALLPA